MAAIFVSIFPIFALVLAGTAMKKARLFDDAFWNGLDRMGFYVLYPVLLFVTVYRADLSALSFGDISLSYGIALIIVAAGVMALWPLMFRAAGLAPGTFSSVFQLSIRWNGFIALAVAEKLFPTSGPAVVALVMAVAIIPINVTGVAVVAWFGTSAPDPGRIFLRVITNPLVVGTVLALLARTLPGPIPEFAMGALDLLARATLGMGLLAIGAGLRIEDAIHPRALTALPLLVKLVLFPILVVAIGFLLQVPQDQLLVLGMCAAVPTAMNGYIVARQLGGDAEFYAAVATLQVFASFFTIPAFLTLLGYATGG